MIDLEFLYNAKGIKIFHVNIRSLLQKFDEVYATLLNGNLDIVIFTETWLHKNVSDSLIQVDGFNLYRLDRQVTGPSGNCKRGGGICIYVKNEFVVSNWTNYNVSNRDIEFLTISCKLGFNRNIVLHTVYRPPTGNAQAALDMLYRNIEDLKLHLSGDRFVLGDFNIDLNKGSNIGSKLLRVGKNLGLCQLISESTRYATGGSSLIDHIYTDCNHVSHSGTVNYNISDHLPIVLVKKKDRNNLKFKEIYGRSYGDFDLSSFLHDIRNVEFTAIVDTNDPDSV